MTQTAYGHAVQTIASDEVARVVEEVRLRGFAVLPSVIPAVELAAWRSKVDALYAAQEAAFGREALAAIQELDVCRAPLLEDFSFLALAQHEKILPVMRALLGDWFILNLQNAIISRPKDAHHQTAWHRDLPHQNFTISRPIAANAMVALDEFSAESGGTIFLPGSHRSEVLPSDGYLTQHGEQAIAPAGSIIFFDAMLFHRTGYTSHPQPRRAINQMYTIPILKQQYDFPRALGARPDLDTATARLLGYDSQVPLDARAWRDARAARRGGAA